MKKYSEPTFNKVIFDLCECVYTEGQSFPGSDDSIEGTIPGSWDYGD